MTESKGLVCWILTLVAVRRGDRKTGRYEGINRERGEEVQ